MQLWPDHKRGTRHRRLRSGRRRQTSA